MRSLIKLPMSLRILRELEFPHKIGILDRLFGKKLAKNGINWVNIYNGIDWKLDLTNSNHRQMVYGYYEGYPFLNWVKKFLPKHGIVVDSGASIGQMAVYFSGWVPNGRVLAFEPGALQADWLEECLTANPKLPVTLFRVGLGALPAQAFIKIMGSDGGNSEICEKEGQPVKIIRLSDKLKDLSVTYVHLWKLDMEGYECMALKGAEDFLCNKQIGAIYAELVGDNSRRILDYLEGYDYYCHFFDTYGKLKPFKKVDLPYFSNGVFLPRKHSA